MRFRDWLCLVCVAAVFVGCSKAPGGPVRKAEKAAGAIAYFKVDPATAGTISGSIRYAGPKPPRKAIDMSGDPACMEAHQGKAYEESLVVGPKGGLANAFVYIKSGLEGKTFETPSAPARMDQHGCWFNPRVLGLQTNQPLQISNTDPVTHNIHPLAQSNREWNHSQGSGDPPITRRFPRPEVMIPVKCNIHSWMRCFIGVVDHPYFAVSGDDGAFAIPNLPPGDYVLEVWHEKLGTQQSKVTVAPSARQQVDFKFKGE
ncbi:MAG TPA: carboxypeptidase regulatory-like domain-containing protein [Verrucomicrobiae bacterium]|nr:carboxypeptidase regulatory-like domain-containing protein [Verrucomicrobiae bacterium]